MGSLPQLSVLKGPTRQLAPNLVDKIFEKVAAAHANSTALVFEDHRCTYEQVDKLTNQYARTIVGAIKTGKLESNGDGDFIVAVNMGPSDRLVVVLLAIWKAGGAYLPLDRAFPRPRIDHIVRESRPVIVISDEVSDDYVNVLGMSVEDLAALSKQQSEQVLSDDERVKHLKDDLAIVLYTSGSTGIPKGVRIPHRAILNRLQWQFKTFPYSASEAVCIFKTALTFVDSVSEIWGPLISGLSVLVISKPMTKDPEKLVAILDRYKVERLVLVPSLLKSLLLYREMQKSENILENLRLWICSGEILSAGLAREFLAFFPDRSLCNFYGSTEVMGDVTYHVVGRRDVDGQPQVPIGTPVDNTMIYLLDGDLRPVKAGAAGELFVAGLNLAAGYVRGRDAERFVDNPLTVDPVFARLYRTGDFARLQGGTLLYEGRTDSQVKVRGHRIDLVEVEHAVAGVDGVEKAVVLCYKPGEMHQALLAFVTTAALLNEQQIEAILKTRLTAYMVPQIILIENVPLLVNGKVDRQQLLKIYENTNNNDDECFHADIDYAGVATHQIDAAKVLFETVSSVLGRLARQTISIDANFYEIGGNSLNSILTITNLNKHGYYISIADFIAAIDFGEILERMTTQTTAAISKQPPAYQSELLRDEHKAIVLDMITSSFYQKADLEQWLMPNICESDYAELMDELWPPLVEKRLSFVVTTELGRIVAVALNFDAYDEPDVQIASKLNVIFDFLEYIEGPVREARLPKGKGRILHSFMMGTHSTLKPKENVAVMQFMEDEVLRLATSREFEGIFTTNTSPLTQQLGSDVYKYMTLLDYQVNQYVAKDNTRPFGLAPDTQRAIVQWKPIK